MTATTVSSPFRYMEMFMGNSQIRSHFGDANLAEKITELYVVLAVILINDAYVANPYQWSSLIRIFFMPKCIITE